MDPASSIMGFIATSYQIVKVVRDILRDMKAAPKEIRKLLDRVGDIEMVLRELERLRMDGLFNAPEDHDVFINLGHRVDTCLTEIGIFVRTMGKSGKDGRLVVNKPRWLMKGDTLQTLLVQLDQLDCALNAIMNVGIS